MCFTLTHQTTCIFFIWVLARLLSIIWKIHETISKSRHAQVVKGAQQNMPVFKKSVSVYRPTSLGFSWIYYCCLYCRTASSKIMFTYFSHSSINVYFFYILTFLNFQFFPALPFYSTLTAYWYVVAKCHIIQYEFSIKSAKNKLTSGINDQRQVVKNKVKQ